MRVRDTQKGKVYKWERQYHEKATMSLDECASLAAKVTRHFKMREVYIRDGRGCRSAYSYGGSIGLPKWSRQPTVVLHEMAHEVERWLRFGRVVAWHGREFVGIEMYLLTKFGGHDIKDLTRTANEARVDFISQSTVRERLRERRNYMTT